MVGMYLDVNFVVFLILVVVCMIGVFVILILVFDVSRC